MASGGIPDAREAMCPSPRASSSEGSPAGPACAEGSGPVGPSRSGQASKAPVNGGAEQAPSATPAPPADLACGLQRTPKYLPCRFLYDDRGSQLYADITQLEEYYPFRTEQQLLAAHADAIASQTPAGSVVLELGCGDSSKTSLLLAALRRRHGARGVRFCGVDCSGEALRQTEASLARLAPWLPAEQVELVEAEYLPGIRAVRARHPVALLTILWLGSSVGNFSQPEAGTFLSDLHAAAGEHSQLLLATDMWKDPGVLHRAYHDSHGVSQAFILNGMHHALRVLGCPKAGDPGLFDYEPVVNEELQQVEMYVTAQRRLPDVLPGVHIEAGQRVLVEISRKFTPQTVAAMASEGGLCLGSAWATPAYRLQLLLPPALALRRCWRDTDSIFAAVHDWTAQPIGLRHPWLFYAGHCAAFAKLKLLPEEPASELDLLFSRGIDPLVSDPSQCHAHPPVPAAWPGRAQVESYVAGVRRQLLAAMSRATVSGSSTAGNGGCTGEAEADGKEAEDGEEAEEAEEAEEGEEANGRQAGQGEEQAGGGMMRRLAMALEHERMHQETLCYMAAQQHKADSAACAAAADSGGTCSPVMAQAGAGLAAAGSEAGEAVPFYQQQCSYASIPAAAADGSDSEGPAGRDGAPPQEPATPGLKGEGLAGRLASLRLAEGMDGEATAGGSDGKEARVPAGFVVVPPGKVTIGIDPSCSASAAGPGATFLWDCEVGQLGPLEVPGLAVAAGPVTVAQYRRFVFEEQGYSRPELWDADAYSHLCASGHSMPATWSLLDSHLTPPGALSSAAGAAAETDGGSSSAAGSPGGSRLPASRGSGAGGDGDGQKGQQGQQQQQLWVHMPEGSYCWEEVAQCPVYVSLAEARAYCRLHGCRVMTEAEWELAAGSQASAEGTLSLLDGGGWEWTDTPFEPLPGFQPDPLYREFSADFFDGEHYVLRGSSPYTHPSMARRSFRNYYQRLYPFVFAKFRPVLDLGGGTCQ